MVAPVLPAATMADALPSRTASAARTSEESFLRRTPCAGSSSMAMTSDAAMTSSPPVSPTSSGRPTSTTGMPSSSAAWRAPATISPGALSPPIASTAMGSIGGSWVAVSPLRTERRPAQSTSMACGRVPAAVAAHHVRAAWP